MTSKLVQVRLDYPNSVTQRVADVHEPIPPVELFLDIIELDERRSRTNPRSLESAGKLLHQALYFLTARVAYLTNGSRHIEGSQEEHVDPGNLLDFV